MILPNKVDQEGPPGPILIRQGSLYNFTLDEMNSQIGNIGKPLNTMNLDELFKNVIAAEEGHDLIQNHSSSASSSSSSSSANMKLDHALSKRTVDEAWNEIVDQKIGNVNLNIASTRRQMTLGETTLEEFLIRAGVLSLGNRQNNVTNAQPLPVFDPVVLMKQQRPDWIHFDMDIGGEDKDQEQQVNIPMPIQAPRDSSQFQVFDIGFENNQVLVNAGFVDNLLDLTVEATSSNLHFENDRKRRYADERMERSIQRRQRRMIKNRESAARSRARKQAYTKQLEENVQQLKAENFGLKKQKEIEMFLGAYLTLGPHHQLRRTSSAPF